MYKKIFVCSVLMAVWTVSFASGRADSKLAKEYFELGQAFAEVSKYEKAIEYYQKAAADPAHKNAAEYNLARVYGLQNDWGNARKLLEKHYKAAPDNTVIGNAFAYALAASGDIERASHLYKALYNKDKENPESAFNYVRILITAKKYQEGLAFLESVKADFPENAEKRIYDELEAKLKKLLEPPKEDVKEESPKNPVEDASAVKAPKGSNSEKGTVTKKDGEKKSSNEQQSAARLDTEKPASVQHDNNSTGKIPPAAASQSAKNQAKKR